MPEGRIVDLAMDLTILFCSTVGQLSLAVLDNIDIASPDR